MDIKRIIKEEMDDFDWVRDIKPTNPIDDFLMNKFHEKMVGYLTMSGREGDIISREWATVEAFLIELKKLKENSFVNFLSRILLQSHVERPYPHTLEAIEIHGFDVNKSEETKRLYKKFQSYNSFGNRIKRTLKNTFLRENDFGWVEQNPIEVGKCLTLKSNSHGDILVKVSKIETPKDTNKLNDLATLNQTKVYFDSFDTGYPLISLRYSGVENYINSGVIIPCDCPTVKESKNNLNEESGVENYLQSIASITSGNQKKYYQWILDNLEQVPVVSYRSNEELKEKVDRFVKKMRRFGDFCQKKGCFDTAYNTAMYVPGVHYIEGYVQSMIPLVHAWNYLPEEGIYFDLINDIAWEEEDSHFNEYYKVIDLDKSGVLKWSSETGYGGGFIENPKFISSILK